MMKSKENCIATPQEPTLLVNQFLNSFLSIFEAILASKLNQNRSKIDKKSIKIDFQIFINFLIDFLTTLDRFLIDFGQMLRSREAQIYRKNQWFLNVLQVQGERHGSTLGAGWEDPVSSRASWELPGSVPEAHWDALGPPGAP